MSIETVAEFKILFTRYLDNSGKAIGDLPPFAEDSELMQSLYRWMVLTRTFDAKAINLQRTGKMGTYASSLGQEAIGVAIGNAMAKNDILAPPYREYGAQFQRGVTMTEMFAFWGGTEQGNNFSNCPDFPIAVPIGTQPLHAAGIAAAFKYRKEKRVAVSVCGDGATSQGDFYEAINVAGAWQLPVVFVVSNNQWAISIARHYQTFAKTIAQKAIAAGIPGQQVDGNDMIATLDVIKDAIERARAGKGPSLIEAITYRLHDHTTADDASRYRLQTEVEAAWQAEPVKRLRTFLEDRGWWNDTKDQELIADCQKQVDAAVEAYFKFPAEPVTAMFDYHYANMPEELRAQREIAEAFAERIKHH